MSQEPGRRLVGNQDTGPLRVRASAHTRGAYNVVNQLESEDAMFEKPFIGTPPDYSDPKNWLVLPDEATLPADVIYLYPTA